MTVASVVAPTEAARPGATSTAPGPAAPGGTEFAAALAAATEAGQQSATTPTAPTRVNDPAALPTVSLATMVEAFANAPNLGAPAAPPQAPGVEGVEAVSAAAGVGASGRGAAVLAAGEQYLGTPYLWGGTDPNVGFDCSGFVQRAFADIGITLPRVSADQSKAGTAVASLDQAQPGDLVYWNGTGGSPNHIGIYAGEGRMLEAPSAGKVVRYRDITRTPDAIRRVV